jgi:hypothetical protein
LRTACGCRTATCSTVAEAEEVGLPDVQILEQGRGIICGLHESERPVRNVRGVAKPLLLECDDLPVARERRQHMAK